MSDNKSGGMGFCSVLGLIFIVLKLVGVITWSWKWVLAPIWIPIVIAIIVFVVTWIKMKLW